MSNVKQQLSLDVCWHIPMRDLIILYTILLCVCVHTVSALCRKFGKQQENAAVWSIRLPKTHYNVIKIITQCVFV